MLNAEQMQSLPRCFANIPDPRRKHGIRHPLPVVLGIAAGAVLCGMEGYEAISDWAELLGQKARERFGCRRVDNVHIVPSVYVIRECLIRIDPDVFDNALTNWQQAWGQPVDTRR